MCKPGDVARVIRGAHGTLVGMRRVRPCAHPCHEPFPVKLRLVSPQTSYLHVVLFDEACRGRCRRQPSQALTPSRLAPYNCCRHGQGRRACWASPAAAEHPGTQGSPAKMAMHMNTCNARLFLIATAKHPTRNFTPVPSSRLELTHKRLRCFAPHVQILEMSKMRSPIYSAPRRVLPSNHSPTPRRTWPCAARQASEDSCEEIALSRSRRADSLASS